MQLATLQLAAAAPGAPSEPPASAAISPPTSPFNTPRREVACPNVRVKSSKRRSSIGPLSDRASRSPLPTPARCSVRCRSPLHSRWTTGPLISRSPSAPACSSAELLSLVVSRLIQTSASVGEPTTIRSPDWMCSNSIRNEPSFTTHQRTKNERSSRTIASPLRTRRTGTMNHTDECSIRFER